MADSETKSGQAQCQMVFLDLSSEALCGAEVMWQRRSRLVRIVRRRLQYARNLIRELLGGRTVAVAETAVGGQVRRLQPGDLVRVRAGDQIQQTLNRWNQLKGCAFMEEMRAYCGTEQRVFKRIEKFLDERDYLVKKCRGIVILEGVLCEGTRDFGGCDRSCFFFWREEWLEEVT